MSNSADSNEPEDLSELLERAILFFVKRNIRDKALWKNFQNQFNEISKDEFELFINSQQKRDLIDFLRSRNVWVRRQSLRIYSQTLYDTLNENELVSWTEDEYNKALNSDENLDSSVIHRSIQNDWKRMKSSTRLASAAALIIRQQDNQSSSKYLLSSSHTSSVEYSRLSQIHLSKIELSEYSRSSEIKSNSTSSKHVFSNLSMSRLWQSSITNSTLFINLYIRQLSTSKPAPPANFYIWKQSSGLESTEKSKEHSRQTTDKEELEVFERNQSFMKSRMTRDYWMNENNRNFEASNDDRNFITNASASTAADVRVQRTLR